MPREPRERDLFRDVKGGIEQVSYHADRGMLRNPFSNLAANLCRVGVHTVEGVPRRGDNVRIALVSMPEFSYETKPFSSLIGRLPPGVDDEACTRRLVMFRREASRQMLITFKDALTTALDTLKADIVCVSELGLPSRNLIPSTDATRFAHKISEKYGALIIAGSSHDSRTLYNTAYLFHPGGPKTGRAFHKSVSAVSTGELVSAPAARRILGVNIFGLGIATMICLDIADYASLASVMKVADAVDVLLVPCYTDKFEKMVEIATVASKALPGVVALVNANLPHSVAASCHIARFGALEKPTSSLTLPSGAVISVMDLGYDDFHTSRTRLKTSPENQMEWLFGSRDRPQVYR